MMIGSVTCKPEQFEGLDPYENTYWLGFHAAGRCIKTGLDPYENTYWLGMLLAMFDNNFGLDPYENTYWLG